jgi:hypothetical protein
MRKFLSGARKQRFLRAAHLFSGLLIFLHGFERYDGGHALWPVFAVFGFIFILLALFHGRLARKWPAIDGVFFLIEAVLSFVIMGEFFHMGKRGLPYMYLFAALAQACAAWITWRRKRRTGTH